TAVREILMKFLSRNAPALDARIVLNPREKTHDFLESAAKKGCGLQLWRRVVGLAHEFAKTNGPFHARVRLRPYKPMYWYRLSLT
ncbi:MAG: hypothetical protein RL126_983, partial [Actinomycetota bacterium]